MKKIYFILSALALGMASCTNFFDEKQLGNVDFQPSDVRTGMTYTLTDDDYAAVAKNEANKAKALAVDSVAYLELQAIGTNKSFTETASADMYVGALMLDKFPYLDNGTVCEVSYRMQEGKSNNVKDFSLISAYELTTADYEAIWQKRGANYVTPATEASVATYLKTKFVTAVTGRVVVLTYQYSEAEPADDEMTDFLPYALTLGQLLAFPDDKEHEITGKVGTVKSSISGRFYMVDGQDSIYVYGLNDEEGNKVWKDKGIQTGDQITIKAKYSIVSGEPQLVDGVYVSHAAASPAPRRAPVKSCVKVKKIFRLGADGEWAEYVNDQVKAVIVLPQNVYDQAGVTVISDMNIIVTYLRAAYPYVATEEKYLVVYNGKSGYTADEWEFDGTEFVQNTGYVTESMSFEVKNHAWIPNISTYLQTAFVGEGLGKFTIQHVNLDGLSYVWRYQAAYGATASAYVSSVNHRVEDWLISPNIRLKKSVAPQLTYSNAVRYGNTTDNPTWLNVMVTNNFTGDVTTTEWEKLEFPAELPDGSNWIFQPSGVFDLSKYNGQTIVIAFRYKTDFDGIEVPSAPTWEIQNLLVAEPEEENVEE